MENFWPTCLGRFKQELSAQQFNTWIKPLRCEVVDGCIRLLAPNRFVQQWVKDRFLGRIEQLGLELLGNPVTIDLALFVSILMLPRRKNQFEAQMLARGAEAHGEAPGDVSTVTAEARSASPGGARSSKVSL